MFDEQFKSHHSEDRTSKEEPPSRSVRDEKSIAELRSLVRGVGFSSKITSQKSFKVNEIDIDENLLGEEESVKETDALPVANAEPHISKIIDMMEDCNSILSEDRRLLNVWQRCMLWMSSRSITVTIVLASLVATIILWALDSNSQVLQEGSQGTDSRIWVWTAIPGLLAVFFLGAYLLEISLLRSMRIFVVAPPWLFPLMEKSLRGYLRAIAFSIAFERLILQAWFNFARVGSVDLTLGHQLLRSLYTILIGLVIKTLFNQLIEMWGAEKSFGKRIKLLLFLEDVLLNLCCRNDTDRKDLEKLRSSKLSGKNILADLEYIRGGAIQFPLKHQDDSWVFSTDSSIVVSTTMDMGLIGDIIFKNVLEDKKSNTDDPAGISLEIWCSYWENAIIGVQAFRMMFFRQGTALQNKSVSNAQFCAACKSVFNSWTVLANRLKGFENLSHLIQTSISAVFWVFMIIFVFRIFGYEFNQFLTAISALMLSVAFALSNTITRFVESVVFIFGGKPFQVNDAVTIDGTWYQVQKICLLDTWFKDRVNKLVRYPNQTLADCVIVNLTNSFGCVTRICMLINFDTNIQALERLKRSILKFAVDNPDQWKPRVAIFLNDTSQCNQIELEIRIDSVYKYIDGASFRVADTELKHHIRKRMLKLGIRYYTPAHPIKIERTITTNEPEHMSFFSDAFESK